MLFTLKNKPNGIPSYRKASTVQLLFVAEPFEVETQEGKVRIAPDTVDDWEDGYYVAYPDDGSKPYAISPSFVRKNYRLLLAQTARQLGVSTSAISKAITRRMKE